MSKIRLALFFVLCTTFGSVLAFAQLQTEYYLGQSVIPKQVLVKFKPSITTNIEAVKKD